MDAASQQKSITFISFELSENESNQAGAGSNPFQQWLQQWPADGGSILLRDERLAQETCRSIDAQLATHQQGVWLLTEHRQERNYLNAFLTWLHFWLMRCLFGLRKAPSQAAALWIEDAESARTTLQTLAQQHATDSRPSWARRWLATTGFAPPSSQQLDRLAMALAVEGHAIRQIEFDSRESIPRPVNWRTRFKALATRLMAMALVWSDWWNWKCFPSQNRWSLQTGTTPNTLSQPKRRWHALAGLSLLVLSIGVLAYQLNYPLFEPDEARNAQLAINIVETGDWVSLRLGPEPYWDKPPAVAWGTALAYRTFGISAWTTRLVSNLSALLTVMLVFCFGRLLVGFRAAWLGGVLLLLSTGFVVCGRYATMDAAITLCATTMLGSLYLAVRDDRFRSGFWLLASIACGVGLLVKGPVIGVLTVPPFLVWMAVTRNPQLWRITRWLVMAVIALSIAGPWFVTMGLTEPEFLVYFFWKHHVVRFSDAFNHREPFWFYLPVVVLGTFPASLLLPTLLPLFRKYGPACRQALTPATGLLAIYAAWVIGFFSLSDSKLPTYILPSFPAVALLYATAAVAFVDDLKRQPNLSDRFVLYFQSIPRRVAASIVTAVVVFSIVSALLFKQNALSGGFLVLAMVGSVFSVAAWLLNQKLRYAVGLTLALGLMFVVTITAYVLPGVSTFRSIQRTTAQLQAEEPLADLPIVFYNHENYGCQLWLPDEKVTSFDDYQFVQLLNYLEKHPRCLIISRLEAMEMLRSNLPEEYHLSAVKGARRLYLCYPESPLPDAAVERLSERLSPVTFSR